MPTIVTHLHLLKVQHLFSTRLVKNLVAALCQALEGATATCLLPSDPKLECPPNTLTTIATVAQMFLRRAANIKGMRIVVWLVFRDAGNQTPEANCGNCE